MGVRFPARGTVQEKGGKAPIPSRVALETSRATLWSNALEKSTAAAYRRAYRLWTAFTLALSFPIIPTANSLLLFTTWRL